MPAEDKREKLQAERAECLAKAAWHEEQSRALRARAFEAKKELAALVDAEAAPEPKKPAKKRAGKR